MIEFSAKRDAREAAGFRDPSHPFHCVITRVVVIWELDFPFGPVDGRSTELEARRIRSVDEPWTKVVDVSTGCRDKTAAQSVLVDLEHRAEGVRSNLITAAEDRIADPLTTPSTATLTST